MSAKTESYKRIWALIQLKTGSGDPIEDLGRIGIPARRGRAKVRELLHLRTPALLQDSQSQWHLVLSAGGRGGEGYTPERKRWLAWDELWPTGEGDFIEFLAEIPWEADVLPVAGRRAQRQIDLVLPILAVATGLSFLALWSTWIVARIVDANQAQGKALVVGVATMAALGIIQAGLIFVRFRLTSALEQGERFEFGVDLLRRLLSQPYARIAQRNSGDVGYAMESASVFAGLVASLLGSHWLDAVQCLIGVGVVFWLSPAAGLALVAFGGGVWALHVAAARSRMEHMTATAKAATIQMGYLSEALAGAVTIKTQGAERLLVDRWFRMVTTEVALDQRSSVLGILANSLTTALSRLFSLSILLVASYLVMSGQLGLGGMMLIIQVGMAQTVAISALAETLPISILGIQPRLERIRELVCHPPEQMKPAENWVVSGRIEVEEASFQYPGSEDWAVRNANFKVEPGGRHWLMTPSGSGKTTLLRLLAGLYRPTNGSISIDGMPPHTIVSGMLYLPQSIRLFSGSIRQNLGALSGVEDDEKLMEISRQTGLDDFVATLPMGYLTPLQNAGGALSGGQRQLIALTAALASEAKVLLLDEAMANLDWSIRPRLASLEAFKGRTVVYASHDRFFGP